MKQISYKIILLVFSIILLPSVAYAMIVRSANQNSIIGAATITESGTYVLARNITGTITIEANNVILDLNKFAINGNGASCVVANNVSNVTIQNGFLENFVDGINANTVDNLTLTSVTIQLGAPTAVRGLLCANCVNININDSSFNYANIQITTSTDILITSLKSLNNAITFSTCERIEITESIIQSITAEALIFSDPSNLVLTNLNIESLSGDPAILIAGAFSTIVISNCVCKGGGITLASAPVGALQYITIKDCVVTNAAVAPAVGILLSGEVAGVTISGCDISGAATDGINIGGSASDCCIINNKTNFNGLSGIVDLGSDTSFFLNKAQGNPSGNYSGVPLVAVFDMSSGTFTTPPTTAFDNISVVP